MKTTRLNVKTKSENYPIIIGSDIVKNLGNYLKNNSINPQKCLLVIDKNVPRKMISKIVRSLKKKKLSKFFFNASEKRKNLNNTHKILKILLNKNYSRLDCLIAIGGGITGDVGGFAASLYKRGIKFVNVPTTLLSQVDSAVGGKTGINTKEGKNLIGSFYQPKLVVTDTKFLKSLPNREIICGYGEIFKHSLIMNKSFYNFLDKNSSKILELRSPFIEKAILESCKIKKKIVEKDEKEKGKRKILNFGHTFAHAYEAALGYSKKLNHGEAVILGIISALKFSFDIKLIKLKEYNQIINHIIKMNLPSNIQNYFSLKNLSTILTFMIKDKKNISEKVNLILLKKIGSTIIDKEFQIFKVKNFLKKELTN